MSEAECNEPSRLTQLAVYGVGMFAEGAATVVIPLWVLSLNPTPAMFGIVIGAKGVLPLLFSIHGGVLMDKFGARQVLLLASVVGVLLPILFPVLPYIWSALILQMMFGLVSTLSWIGAQTLVSQNLGNKRLYFARLSFSNRTGVFVCPLLAGAAWDMFGATGGFAIMIAFGVVSLLCVLSLPHPATNRESSGRSSLGELIPRMKDYREAMMLLALPAVLLTSLGSIVNVAVGTVQQSFYIVYLENIGMTGTLIGVLVAAPNLLGVAGTLWMGGVARRLGEMQLLIYSVMLSTLAVVFTPMFATFIPLLLLGCVRGWGMGVAQPLMLSIPSKAVRDGAHGSAAGLRISVNRLVQAVLPPVMGLIVEWVGLNNAFYVVGAALLALGVFALGKARALETPDA